MNDSSYVKNPLRSSAILNFKKDVRFCFIWSILANFRTCNSHPIRVSYYRQYLDKLIIDGFGHSNGFACSDAHRFEKFYSLSFNKLELNNLSKKILEA